jgi:ribosomal protein S27AE
MKKIEAITYKKAKCTRCGKVWIISVLANPKRYLCPHCSYKISQVMEKDDKKSQI